jgi:glutathione synthase/RimK-type ligase-like ATP-grasp enzyme
VLKQPDSAFSQGVEKASTREQLEQALKHLLAESELVVAQAFVPTEYDWRVGVLDGKPLYACRYYMARGHWQIIKSEAGAADFGKVETLAVEEAPGHVVRAAVRAAQLIGDGLYGVDLKQHGRRCYVIEVNDNPNLDAGYEDRVLRAELYERVMTSFVQRIERLKAPRARR